MTRPVKWTGGAAVAAAVAALLLAFLVFPRAKRPGEALELARQGEALRQQASDLGHLADDLEEDGRSDLAEVKREEAGELAARAEALFARAEELIRRAEGTLGPDNRALKIIRGVVAFREGDYARARGLLETAADATDGARIVTMLGTIALHSGDVRRAIALFRRAAEADPQDAEAHLRLGSAYLVADSAEEALPVLERAGTLDSTDGEIQNMLGIAYERVLRFEKAERAFAKAVLLEPERLDFVRDLEELRKAKAASKDVAAAWKAFEAGLARESAAWKALRAGRADESVEHLIGAAASYRTAIANVSSFHAAHYHRGRCYAAYGGGRSLIRERREYLAQAAEHFRAALTGRPKWAPYRFALAKVLRDLGRAAEAREVLHDVLRDNPRSGRAHYELAYIHAYAEEDIASAHRELAAARRLGVEPDPVFLKLIEEIEAEREAPPESEGEKEARLAAERAMGEADIFAASGDVRSAARSYTEAYEALSGQKRRPLFLLRAEAAGRAGRAFEAAKHYRRALAWYGKALALRPANKDFRENVSRLEAIVERLERTPSGAPRKGAREEEGEE